MPHPLQLRIAAIRRRVRLLLLLYGAGCAAATAATGWALLALGDYLFRYEETGIRLLSSVAAAAVAAAACYRFFRPIVEARLSDVFIARQIERRFPELHERLAGAVAFLHAPDDDAAAGSPQLRRAVIHETTQEALPLPLSGVVRLRPIVVPLVFAALGLTAVAGLYLADRTSASIALRRLALPLGDASWPQVNRLKVLNPVQRLPAGGRLKVDVVDAAGAEIDGEVKLLVRNSSDGEPESLPMQLQAGAWSAERKNVTADFAYRAVGGDDRSMPWIEVQVVDPPAVREVEWSYRYPEYAAWKTFASGPRPGDALVQLAPVPVGTTIEFHVRTNKPVREARLVVGAGEVPQPAVLDADRLGFALTAENKNAWLAARSESFRFEMIGDDDFAGGRDLRYEIHVESDPPPWVKLLRPRGTPEDPRGDVFVTPDAVVEVDISTGDAFTVRPQTALKSVALRYSRSDRSSEPDQSTTLYAGPSPLEPAEFDAPTQFRDEEIRKLDYAWDLKPLGFVPGTFVTLYAAGTDYAGQERPSESRRLRVVGAAEFLDRFNERQRALHAELHKIRDRQSEAVAETDEAAGKLKENADAEAQRDDVSRAHDRQRQVAAALGLDRAARRTDAAPEANAENRGVQGRVERMLADLRANRIDNREVTSRLAAIEQELARLAESNAAESAAEKLAESLRDDPTDEARRAAAAETLADAKRKQQQVLQSLDAMLGNLSQWEDYGKFHEELSSITDEQRHLAAETRKHLQQRLGKSEESSVDAAKRDELASRQSGLARRFESLRQQLARARGDENRDTLGRALEAAESANPAGAMRAAGDELRNDRVGRAPAKQQEALEKLQQVMQALSAQNADELSRLVKKLREGEKELAALREAQQGLQKKFRDAEKIADEAARRKELERLSREQRELQRQTEKLAEQLKRLKADRSAARTARSSSRMGQAGQGGEQGDAAAAGEQAEAAEKDLESAQQELAEERRKAEADLARELAAKLEDDLQASIARQERVLEETKRYETASRDKPLSRAELIGLLDLAREQEALEAETRAAGERFEQAPAFRAAIDGAADAMQRAAQSLRERDVGPAAQRAEETALRRFKQLVSALEPRQGGGGQSGEGQGGGSGGGSGSGGNQDAHSLAELILVKLMQEDVAARTKELDEAAQRGKLSPADEAEYRRLGDEQGKLADLLLDLIGSGGDGEDAPAPEIKLEDLKSEK